MQCSNGAGINRLILIYGGWKLIFYCGFFFFPLLILWFWRMKRWIMGYTSEQELKFKPDLGVALLFTPSNKWMTPQDFTNIRIDRNTPHIYIYISQHY